MFKEKLQKVLKINEGNSKKKIENLSFFLIILVITVIVINTIWKDEDDNKDNTINDNKEFASITEDNNERNLEKDLEEILENMNGVGNVKVMLTYNETEEIVPVYNTNDKKSIINETDSTGGTRKTEEIDKSEEIVLQNEEIVVKKKVSPKIEGAIITATGASNAVIKNNIIQAVEAVTGLATHKIQVFEKKN